MTFDLNEVAVVIVLVLDIVAIVTALSLDYCISKSLIVVCFMDFPSRKFTLTLFSSFLTKISLPL